MSTLAYPEILQYLIGSYRQKGLASLEDVILSLWRISCCAIRKLHARYVQKWELNKAIKLQSNPFCAFYVACQIAPSKVSRGREAGGIASPSSISIEQLVQFYRLRGKGQK